MRGLADLVRLNDTLNDDEGKTSIKSVLSSPDSKNITSLKEADLYSHMIVNIWLCINILILDK